MAIRKIIQLQSRDFFDRQVSLRMPSRPVEHFDDALRSSIKDLVDTFESHHVAVGLAAPQIGIQLRASVINAQKGKPLPHLILINPKIISGGEERVEKFESCMSLPLRRGKVNRLKKIKISFQDENGQGHTMEAEDFLARVIQHEIDHLDGILYVDRMKIGQTLEESEIPPIIE